MMVSIASLWTIMVMSLRIEWPARVMLGTIRASLPPARQGVRGAVSLSFSSSDVPQNDVGLSRVAHDPLHTDMIRTKSEGVNLELLPEVMMDFRKQGIAPLFPRG